MKVTLKIDNQETYVGQIVNEGLFYRIYDENFNSKYLLNRNEHSLESAKKLICVDYLLKKLEKQKVKLLLAL